MLFDIYIFNFWIIVYEPNGAIWLSPIFQNVSPVSPVGVRFGGNIDQKMSHFVVFCLSSYPHLI